MSTTHEEHQGPDYDGIQEGHNRPPLYFMILYIGLIVWGLLFIAYFLFSGWSSEQEFKEKMEAHQKKTAVVARALPTLS